MSVSLVLYCSENDAARDGKERRFLLDWVTYLLQQCLDAGTSLEGVQVPSFAIIFIPFPWILFLSVNSYAPPVLSRAYLSVSCTN
jgi:hypothetical protein